jgi:hypothetical protein
MGNTSVVYGRLVQLTYFGGKLTSDYEILDAIKGVSNMLRHLVTPQKNCFERFLNTFLRKTVPVSSTLSSIMPGSWGIGRGTNLKKSMDFGLPL